MRGSATLQKVLYFISLPEIGQAVRNNFSSTRSGCDLALIASLDSEIARWDNLLTLSVIVNTKSEQAMLV